MNYSRDGCAAGYSLNGDVRPQLLFFIKDCHQNGEVEVSAIEKIDNTIVTVSNNSPNIHLWHWSGDKKDSKSKAKSYVMNNQVFRKFSYIMSTLLIHMGWVQGESH